MRRVNKVANSSAEQLVEQNNHLRELLSKENKAYYEDILMYMRTLGLFYNELETEKQLMMILQDILEAQKNGESAESFFGKHPKEMVDQITKQYDRPSWKSIFKMSGWLFLISSLFVVIGSFTAPLLQINIFVLLMNGVFSIALIYGLFKLIHVSIYMKAKLPKFIQFFILWLILMLSFGVFFLIQFYAPKQGIVKIGPPIDWILIIGVVLTAVLYISTKKKREFYGALAFILTLGIFGLLLRIPQTREYLQNDQNHIYMMLGVILPFALFILINLFTLWKMKDDQKV